MTKVRPYPEYKGSGVQWLGEMPAHWARVHGGAVLQQKNASNRGMIESTVLSLSYGRIVVKPSEKLHGLVPESFETYQIVDPGDIIVRPTDLQNDWNTIRVAIAHERGIITSAYICFRARKPLTAEYAHLLLLAYDLKKIFYGMGSGLRQNLEWADFKRLPILLPSPDEQSAIVSYVHAMDAKINRFIRNRRQLIELLNDQKQAIINRVVTRGLDPSVQLKPSGIDWLGEIPEQWSVVPIKRLFRRMDYGISESASDEGRYRVLTMGNIKNGQVTLDGCGRVNEVPAELVLNKHDLLFNRTNSLELVGKVGLFEGTSADDVTFASYLVRMTTEEEVLPGYANILLNARSVLSFVRLHAIPSLHQANLNPTRYGRLPVPLPPQQEQLEILKLIAARCEPTDRAIEEAQREIDLVREYRTRLIADVVTGKLDARHFAAADPVEVDNLTEALDAVDKEQLPAEDEPELVEEAAGGDA